jgi:hypothetical protein
MKGRPPKLDQARGHYLRVRLAPQELDRLDKQRGEATRSDFVPGLLERNAKRRNIE